MLSSKIGSAVTCSLLMSTCNFSTSQSLFCCGNPPQIKSEGSMWQGMQSLITSLWGYWSIPSTRMGLQVSLLILAVRYQVEGQVLIYQTGLKTMKESEEADTSRCHDFIHYCKFKWIFCLKSMLELSQKTLSSQLPFCVKVSGWKSESLTTGLWWYVFSVALIFTCLSGLQKLMFNYKSLLSFPEMASERRLSAKNKITAFFDHSNICVGFQLAECSVSWETALWFSLWEPDWSFTWEGGM